MSVFQLDGLFNFDRAVQDGTLFTASHIFPTVGSLTTVYAHMTATTRRVAIKVHVNSTGHLVVNSYSQSTYTDIGSNVLMATRNTGSIYTPVSIVKHSPIIATLGTHRITQNIPGGDKQVTAVGSTSDDGLSIILVPGVDILLAITNHAQDTADIGVLADFVEEIN